MTPRELICEILDEELSDDVYVRIGIVGGGVVFGRIDGFALGTDCFASNGKRHPTLVLERGVDCRP